MDSSPVQQSGGKGTQDGCGDETFGFGAFQNDRDENNGAWARHSEIFYDAKVHVERVSEVPLAADMPSDFRKSGCFVRSAKSG